MSEIFKWKFIYPSQRMPILANNVVSSSQPLASQAGLRMLLKGGNAVDAAIATAITLTVVEPTMNGIGSDAFALIWDGKELIGLNASGRSPAKWSPEYFSKYKKMPLLGWDTVTVPGAVSGWVELWRKYGNLTFKELFEPAIEYAEKGFLVSPITAEMWRTASSMYKSFPEFSKVFLRNKRSPKPGELFKVPSQAKTLRIIAETEGNAFYHGELAKKIVNCAKETGGLLDIEDFENHSPTWEQPIKINYNNIELQELPPNSQGLAALIALGILKQFDMNKFEPDSVEALHLQIEAMKLAFSDVYEYVSDPTSMKLDPNAFLDDSYLTERASLIDLKKAKNYSFGKLKSGDTVYLTTADSEGMMVSFIQSNYMNFGSGIVIPDTGISLHNRGNCFTLEKNHPNQVGPNKRPFHTIIPAFISKNNSPLMSFGVMGGSMQPQGHLQLLLRIFTYGQNPQTACDAPRWRVMDGSGVKMENGFKEETFKGLARMGHNIIKGHSFEFGGAQLVYRLDNGYIAASDPRKDGQAVGF